jgi:hypothetical protein
MAVREKIPRLSAADLVPGFDPPVWHRPRLYKGHGGNAWGDRIERRDPHRQIAGRLPSPLGPAWCVSQKLWVLKCQAAAAKAVFHRAIGTGTAEDRHDRYDIARFGWVGVKWYRDGITLGRVLADLARLTVAPPPEEKTDFACLFDPVPAAPSGCNGRSRKDPQVVRWQAGQPWRYDPDVGRVPVEPFTDPTYQEFARGLLGDLFETARLNGAAGVAPPAGAWHEPVALACAADELDAAGDRTGLAALLRHAANPAHWT